MRVINNIRLRGFDVFSNDENVKMTFEGAIASV